MSDSTSQEPVPLVDPAAEDSGLPPTSPDSSEQRNSNLMDTVIPTRGYQMTPMVALGGSAGCIPALQLFFQKIPADTGLVFVVIMHLSPEHESALNQVLGRCTTMNVVQATDTIKVRPNTVYIIPPGKHLHSVDGHLRLSELQHEIGKRVAIDLFFRSLADTHGPHAVAIVLSGSDGDGAVGIRRIKERGGLTIAQEPNEAEHPSMPMASIDTGMVDWVLHVGEMPGRMLTFLRQETLLRLPPEEAPPSKRTALPGPHDGEVALRDVLLFLRTRTGRDFSHYKRATIVRRLARRMQVNAVEDMPDYLAFLRTHPGEAGALLQDLLISVTNFFRDRDSFAALEEFIPRLFEGKGPGDAIRIWVPACATGEEAYSLAILLLEHARTLDAPPALQVFACDLNEEAIHMARTGLFPAAITADVSEDRLNRYFIKDHSGYRVRRELREMVLFAVHDLLKDPPFSRMDLISCRNLFIYLNREAQKRVFETFHFATKPAGLLFLGSSEAVDEDSALFGVVNKKHRLYSHKPALRVGMPMPTGPSTLLRAFDARERTGSVPVVHGKRFLQDAAMPFALPEPGLDRASLAELHFRLVERLAAPSAVVNADHDIVHLSEHAGQYLNFEGGEPNMNLLHLVHPLLRMELRSALFRAAETGVKACALGVPLEIEGEARVVELRVLPANELAAGFLLVVFESSSQAADEMREGPHPAAAEPIVRLLERELERVKGSLRETIEQYEASTEELKASNEELQAMNEELRSATEELETSREELQSINEELTTVNAEMKGKVEELAGANSDLQNLMASTSIAIIFLDRDLRIKRFTPQAVGLFHLISSDLDRPLAHLKHRLDYPEVIGDAEQVLRTLMPIEREVQAGKDWYLSRLQPYRTVEDQIGGVVMTFVDITDRHLAEDASRVSEKALQENVEELARFNQAAMGRETRMVELKKEINELTLRLGEERRYPLHFEQESPDRS